ncbi:MAG TPA: DUF3293 domain-containing protein [Rhodanobacteraceae bacterium]|nr:DUF3293 domain-containing protein [Rhodanobacteraceae bacterium]
MPIPPEKLQQFRDTEYRVRLPQGGCAVIRIGEFLPRALHGCVGDGRAPWGFITAWNPFAQRASRARNRERQRELLTALRELGATTRAGVGVGTREPVWREPGLFVTGLDFDTLDTLGRRFEQAAIVRGIGYGRAELRALL